MNNSEQALLNTIGANIKRYRIALDISQEELAYRANINKNYLSDTERGRRNISIKSLHKIAKGLKVQVADLLREDCPL